MERTMERRHFTTTLVRSAMALCVVAVARGALGQPRLEIVSAQVVSSASGRPLLRLAGNGSLAFDLVAPAEGPAGAEQAQVVARVYGVERVELASLESLAPFVVSVAKGNGYVDITVLAPADPSLALTVRGGRQPHELEAVFVAR